MNLTDAVGRTLAALRADAPDYLGAGVVDLTTGMLLGADTVEGHPRDVLEVMAAATADLFQGRNVSQIEQMWRYRKGQKGSDDQRREVLVQSDRLVHLFVRGGGNADLVTTVVCRRRANLGLLMSVGRQAAAHLDDA